MDSEIENIFKEFIDSGATPGVNYGIYSKNLDIKGSLGNKGNYKEENGKLINIEEKNDINTLYDIASLTKVICTLPIIFRLYEKNKIDLNDKVNKYLPNFKYDDITINDLLLHISGLPADLEENEITTQNELLYKLYNVKINQRGKFVYSDLGYIILGLIIESVTGKKLDKVFEEEVKIPLSMNNTTFNPKNINLCAPTEYTKVRGLVKGVVHDEKAFSMNGVAGHAGLFSNVDDLMNFGKMILNNGIFNGKKYLDKSTIDMWFYPFIITPKHYKHSYSWFIDDNPNIIEGHKTISFHGFTGPSISIDRENYLIIVSLTNRVHPSRDNKIITNIRPLISNNIYNYIDKIYNEGCSYKLKR